MGFESLLPSPLPLLAGGTGVSAASDQALLTALGGWTLLATTGSSGFSLQNATPTILSWASPNDGNLHRVVLILNGNVTSAETGGAVVLDTTLPGAVSADPQILAGGAGTGPLAGSALRIVAANTTTSLVQSSALTAGAAVIWAELWGA